MSAVQVDSRKLLANPVTEDFEVMLLEEANA